MIRRYTQLTYKERCHIEFLLQEGCGKNDIALRLERHKSSISRELRRNSNSENNYSADTADTAASERCRRILPGKFTTRAKNMIEEKLQIGDSPEQISAHLKKENIFISHELIYQYIDKDRKAGGVLYKLLPRRGNKYKKRNVKNNRRVWKTAAKRNSISERPAIASEKIEVGHWEGDTVESRGHKGGIGTFVDIKSKFVIIRKLNDKSSAEMKNAIINAFNKSPEIMRTLTLDNGTEFALHDEIGRELNTDIYFTTPYSPWERGLNENTNGLIRRFYPKGTDFSDVTEEEILRVQNLLNERPRKTLGFKTPKEVFTKELLSRKEYLQIA